MASAQAAPALHKEFGLAVCNYPRAHLSQAPCFGSCGGDKGREM